MPSTHSSSDNASNPADTMLADSQPLTEKAVYQTPFYYQFLISLLKPLYRLQVWRRSHKRDNYQQEVAQRFGKQYPSPPIAIDEDHKGVIWCHAVSLGETNTVAPLLDMLMANGYQIWLTNTTQTGFARGASRFVDEIAQGRMSHSYVPVDSPAVIETFLAHVQPIAALFVETELWANILTKLAQHQIPSVLVNGRLSSASFKSYQKIAAVSTSMMKNLALIIAQDSDSAKRFRQLGADSAQIRVAGSLKWVINTPKANSNTINIDDQDADTAEVYAHIAHQKNQLAKEFATVGRPVWVAASTHEGEEAVALSLHQQLLSQSALAESLLIIVPRHPERFDAVAELIQKTGLTMARRSNDEPIGADTQVYLADSMGEMMTWYTLATVALVGGSLVDIGGHNPVEPASVATPVIMGRYTQSCQSVVDKLAEVGALYQPNNECYRSVVMNESSETAQRTPNQQTLNSNNKPSHNHATGNTGSTDDTALIYQQLERWLSDLSLAAAVGQVGEKTTAQQQAVLLRQFAMIEDVIEQYAIREQAV
ncbi:3-deoxy-D-manno-octulosonic acid transferase [Psychrobacter sp. PP-21]|uniref:3-deoxy-D-manno-octulosonic acid transferase n=1 Tax=Psychrobacter sp. PP-21 TaxID=2957503 RepID=UPI0029B7A342|nr:3-deoxy-D-manno-octulosonic acid transferase [Psychrobacter sp. PP-21]MDX2372621.1 3-deoxy-D-manno-octulosonic acid transferase [Psychrobacter sp. PP-21]